MSKLKGLGFFNDFVWDDLTDYKLKPQYVPVLDDYSKNLGSYLSGFEAQIMVNLKIFY